MSSCTGRKFTMMNKDDVDRLLDLIQAWPIILSKETNAPTNKLKEEAWAAIANDFNALKGATPRNMMQLKLKWDNLKKAARKRDQLIKMKPSDGEVEYIPPDAQLDRVMSLLGFGTYIEYSIEISKDGAGSDVVEDDNLESEENQDRRSRDAKVPKHIFLPSTSSGGSVKWVDTHPVVTINEDSNSMPISTLKAQVQRRKTEAEYTDNESPSHISRPLEINAHRRKVDVDYFSNEGNSSGGKSYRNKGKKTKRKSVDGRTKLNLAIAKYYGLKSQKLKLEIKLLKKKLRDEEDNT